MMMRMVVALLAIVLLAGAGAPVDDAPSSSLYVAQPAVSRPEAVTVDGKRNPLSPDIAKVSYTAVSLPPARKFAKHDLVTIIVRESAQADVSAELGTEKDTSMKGEITALPRLQLSELLKAQLHDSVITDPPSVDVGIKRDYSGKGDYKTADTVTLRITARIIDVKPNGTLVLEARKSQKVDKESLEITLTGTCRKEDIRSDNTVLSTQMYDLNLHKKHKGTVRRATRKGLLTRLLETVFHF